MATHQEISDAFIGLLKCRAGIFGQWIPTNYWINKLNIDKLDNGKLRKALEVSGKLMTKVEDSTHGHLYIEITTRKLPSIGTKWFIGCFTPKEPNEYVGNFDKNLFGRTLVASWNRWMNNEKDIDEELVEREQPPVQPTQQASPPQNAASTTTPITRAVVSPTVGSPQLQDDDDSDLLQFFRGIIHPQYLSKDDLFISTGIGLRTKLVAFAKQLEAKKQDERLKFYSDTVPTKYSVEDITTIEKDPCLFGKCGIPMSAPAMSEVAQALLNLAERVPEVLHLRKYGGSKGSGKRLVAILPSTDLKRLSYNAKRWMDDIINS